MDACTSKDSGRRCSIQTGGKRDFRMPVAPVHWWAAVGGQPNRRRTAIPDEEQTGLLQCAGSAPHIALRRRQMDRDVLRSRVHQERLPADEDRAPGARCKAAGQLGGRQTQSSWRGRLARALGEPQDGWRGQLASPHGEENALLYRCKGS